MTLALLLIASVVGAAPTYDEVRSRLEADRAALAEELSAAKAKERKAVVAKAIARLHRGISAELIPPWLGTKWAFYGTSETPGEGTIACGYFVTTVLRDAGLKVERVRLAQQASEQIVRTLSPASEIRRYRKGDPEQVIADTLSRGDGLYVIGLDYHVGLLDVSGGVIRFCHSAVLAPGTVVCEPAKGSEGMVSSYHVVGKLLTEDLAQRWLEGKRIATLTALN